MNDEEARWMEPLDLSELGELTAQWLEGLVWAPWNGGSSIDAETGGLVPQLATINRRGYVTDFSQPGEAGDDCAQRAAVTGYCQEEQAECLASISLDSELVVVTHWPDSRANYALPITRVGNRTHTILAGGGVGEPWEGIHPVTARLLSGCCYVEAFDPEWGRDDRLWSSVVAALARDPAECVGSLIDPDLLDGDDVA